MKKNNYPGKLIVFCGLDGAGKTTLIKWAKSFLQQNSIDVKIVKMPSDRIRNMNLFRLYHDSHNPNERSRISAFSLTVLVSGDRLIELETQVKPSLSKGKWVLCDRYAFSGQACCRSHIIDLLVEEFIEPDLAILANANLKTIKQRVKSRDAERDLYYDDEDAKLKQERFLEICKKKSFFTQIDTDSFGAREVLYTRLKQLL